MSSSDEETEVRETEGEKALKKRREQMTDSSAAAGLDANDRELLDQNKVERDQMMEEIQELRQRNERRKKEREIEEKRLAAERAAEEARKKGEEEERKRRKIEEEEKKLRERMKKMAEWEKWTIPKANFVISKKLAEASGEDDSEQTEGQVRKSKEQLDAEKKAILKQRVRILDIAGADNARLAEKLKELHTLITRLEGEKYDLERRYKTMQGQLQQLAELARQAHKDAKDGVKRITSDDAIDLFQQRFAGAPSKVEMYSKYERQKDKRTYDDRKVLYIGPQFGYPPERIQPQKVVSWNEEGVPIYAA